MYLYQLRIIHVYVVVLNIDISKFIGVKVSSMTQLYNYICCDIGYRHQCCIDVSTDRGTYMYHSYDIIILYTTKNIFPTINFLI